MTDVPRLRIVFFGSSIVSDWRNPLATSARPILDSLVAMSHDVLFLEERRNEWVLGMLKTRGLGPERAFAAAYPAIHHRTYDLPRAGNARRVWFAQQVGTADAIIGLPGAPDSVIDEIAAFDSKLVVRGVHERAGAVLADFRIGLAGQPDVAAEFAPAVTWDRQSSAGERSGIALVAYDREIGEHASAALADLDPILVNQSLEKIDGWLAIPEVNLGSLYDRCSTAVIVGDWSDELTWARALLPAAHGCQVSLAGANSEALAAAGLAPVASISTLAASVCELHHEVVAPSISDCYSASRQARKLVDAILQSIADKRAAAS